MASDRRQNRYSDFVALETLFRFENCSSSHCLLSSCVGSMSSSRRIPRFMVLFYSGHRRLFLASLSAYVVVASLLYLRVVGSSFRRVRYILGQVLDVWRHILYRLYLHKLYLPFFAWYLVALLPCYLVTLLLCYLVTLLLCYPVTL